MLPAIYPRNMINCVKSNRFSLDMEEGISLIVRCVNTYSLFGKYLVRGFLDNLHLREDYSREGRKSPCLSWHPNIRGLSIAP